MKSDVFLCMFCVCLCMFGDPKNDYIVQITETYTYAFFYCFSSYIEVSVIHFHLILYMLCCSVSTSFIPCEYLVVLAPLWKIIFYTLNCLGTLFFDINVRVSFLSHQFYPIDQYVFCYAKITLSDYCRSIESLQIRSMSLLTLFFLKIVLAILDPLVSI